MNTLLIPYFLAALVRNNTGWTDKIEHSYDVNITYLIKPDPHDHVHKIQLISTVKCHLQSPVKICCHLYNFTESELFENHNMTREAQTEQMFEVQFNEHGVEGLVIEPPSRMEVVNVLRKIATQFNVIVDQRRIAMSQFMTRENSSMGNCATTYRITREEPEDRDVREHVFKGIDTNSALVILPLRYSAKPGTTLLIEKSRSGCINPPRYVDFSRGILEMGRYVSRIKVSSDKFETLTEFDGKVRFSTESEVGTLAFKEIIQMNLKSISPATADCPTLSYGELIDLNTNNDIPSNFID